MNWFHNSLLSGAAVKQTFDDGGKMVMVKNEGELTLMADQPNV